MNKLDAEAISNLFREHLETQSSSLWDFVQKIVKHHHCTGCNCSPDAGNI